MWNKKIFNSTFTDIFIYSLLQNHHLIIFRYIYLYICICMYRKKRMLDMHMNDIETSTKSTNYTSLPINYLEETVSHKESCVEMVVFSTLVHGIIWGFTSYFKKLE